MPLIVDHVSTVSIALEALNPEGVVTARSSANPQQFVFLRSFSAVIRSFT